MFYFYLAAYLSRNLRAKVSHSFFCVSPTVWQRLVLSHIFLPGIILLHCSQSTGLRENSRETSTRSLRGNYTDREMREMDRNDDGELLLGEEGHWTTWPTRPLRVEAHWLPVIRVGCLTKLHRERGRAVDVGGGSTSPDWTLDVFLIKF